MRNLILKLINWALGYDLSLKISVIESLDTESIARDVLDEHSIDFEMLNNYDWDDFSQRLDNVQHLTDFSEDDFRQQLEESLGVAPTSISNQTLADQIKDLEHDLGLTNQSIEQTDEWFQSFLKATHEHFMQQAGSKD
ncbi:MAG: hypothetical protein CMI60_18125 [Parvibaculum sp.]|nr:hypothetical protein [Parvibaculum sp.]